MFSSRSALSRASISSSVCLGVERADGLLQQQVQGQANAGQRRLQLVADRGHQVALDLVEQPKARHVGEDHGGAEGAAKGIADGEDLRQVGAILAIVSGT